MGNKGVLKMRIQEGASILKRKISLPVSHYTQKEAPFCIRMEESYMVEADVAITFFIGFM